MSDPEASALLVVPPLGFAPGMVAVSLWLVPEGSRVIEGDRVVELVAGAATVDLVAPLSGRLVRQLVDEDQTVEPGEPLAEFRATGSGEQPR